MAVYSLINPSVNPIYEAAQFFKRDCLENDGSLLFSENIWTLDNLSQLKHVFIDNPDEGKDKFIDKLQGQLKNSPKAVIILTSEVLAVYYLFPRSLTVQHKRNTISKILSWAGEGPIPENRPIYKALETGIANTGLGYNVAQFWEVSLIILLAIEYKKAAPQVSAQLANPWTFLDFINNIAVPHNHKIQGRNILCHLFYPKFFERISTTAHKVKIIHAFTGQKLNESDPLDEKLLTIRKEQEANYPGQALDFYRPPLNTFWGWKEPVSGKPSSIKGINPPAKNSPKPLKSYPYSIDSIIEEGCFIDRFRLEFMLDRLRQKKNLILQGPPGTGKTWLAKRLAYVLIGEKDATCVKAVQFHPNMAYEDFIRGWRPCGDGKLKLEDGPLLNLVTEAIAKPDLKFVLVIEEINRGQPAQIFGEMLTLLEADKRVPSESLELCHCQFPGETVYVPENLYLIGTMNIADRSLALVDLALRRRFAFIDLVPLIDDIWLVWMRKNHSLDTNLLEKIQAKMLDLNKTISDSDTLGDQFRIGHSFVTPAPGAGIKDGREWFRQVVITEIKPQLEEYWFDDHQKAADAVKKLLEGF